MRFERLMSHLARESARTQEQFILRDYSTADAGANSHINHIRGTTPCAVTTLTQRGEIGIVADKYWDMKFIFKPRLDWKINHS